MFLYLVAVDSSAGSVYVTGYVAGELDGQTNAGSRDIALLKYDSLGLWQWTRLKGTTGNDFGYGGNSRAQLCTSFCCCDDCYVQFAHTLHCESIPFEYWRLK